MGGDDSSEDDTGVDRLDVCLDDINSEDEMEDAVNLSDEDNNQEEEKKEESTPEKKPLSDGQSTGSSGEPSPKNLFKVGASQDKGLADMETGSEVYMSELLVSEQRFVNKMV